MTLTPAASSRLDAIVVAYESAGVLRECLETVGAAAPVRGVRRIVVDNASTDGSAELAVSLIGAANVVRNPGNLGFAAGVNAGLRAGTGAWIAVINPDTCVPEGALDRLAEILERSPQAALVGPRVRHAAGTAEETVGRFPTLARERVHAFGLDRVLGLEGRRAPFPKATGPVDWVSGCAWLLRREAVESVGPLDEGYFMYYEDVDYCRRLHDAGWQVLATPDVEIEHAVGRGSRATGRLPVDGGAALVRYAGKFLPQGSAPEMRRVLTAGWRIRQTARRLLAGLGDRRSADLVSRYRLALEALART